VLPRLALFAREPVAGTVKTRLAREVGEARAVALYTAFLADLARSLPSPGEWVSLLAHVGEAPGPVLSETFAGWTFATQGDGDLGARMARRAGAANGRPVVIVGSDAPELRASDVRAALRALREADVVFAPAPDGGFSLVGLRPGVPAPALFGGSRWSTAHALEDTRAAAVAAGCRVALLPVIADVDVAADLAALGARLAAGPEGCPSTRRALEELRR